MDPMLPPPPHLPLGQWNPTIIDVCLRILERQSDRSRLRVAISAENPDITLERLSEDENELYTCAVKYLLQEIKGGLKHD